MRRFLTMAVALTLLAMAGCNQYGGSRGGLFDSGQPYLDDPARPKNTGPEPKNVQKLLNEEGFGGPDMAALKAYRASVAKAATVGQKWSLTKAYFDSLLEGAERSRVSLSDEIKKDVTAAGPMAEIWCQYYPEIAQTVRWDPQHLQYIAERLDDPVKTYWSLDLTSRQIAQKWLHILTDLDFTSQPQFGLWFKKYGDKIEWNRKAKLFVLVRRRPAPARPTPKKPAPKTPARKPTKPTAKPTAKPARGSTAKPAAKSAGPTTKPAATPPAKTPTRTPPKAVPPTEPRFRRGPATPPSDTTGRTPPTGRRTGEESDD